MREEESDTKELKSLYDRYNELHQDLIDSDSATRYLSSSTSWLQINAFKSLNLAFTQPDHIDLLNCLFLHREQLSGIISVLYEVYTRLTPGYGEKPELYVPYNILPLDPGGAQQAIMQLPEVRCYMN